MSGMAQTHGEVLHDTAREPCPACGQNWLLSAFGRIQDRCGHCGYDPVAETGTSESDNKSAATWLRNSSETILLGMPQLCLQGLSETWLLKQLGHQHWMMGSVAKIVKLEHAWRRLDGRNDDGFQVAPFPG